MSRTGEAVEGGTVEGGRGGARRGRGRVESLGCLGYQEGKSLRSHGGQRNEGRGGGGVATHWEEVILGRNALEDVAEDEVLVGAPGLDAVELVALACKGRGGGGGVETEEQQQQRRRQRGSSTQQQRHQQQGQTRGAADGMMFFRGGPRGGKGGRGVLEGGAKELFTFRDSVGDCHVEGGTKAPVLSLLTRQRKEHQQQQKHVCEEGATEAGTADAGTGEPRMTTSICQVYAEYMSRPLCSRGKNHNSSRSSSSMRRYGRSIQVGGSGVLACQRAWRVATLLIHWLVWLRRANTRFPSGQVPKKNPPGRVGATKRGEPWGQEVGWAGHMLQRGNEQRQLEAVPCAKKREGQGRKTEERKYRK